MPLVLVEHEAMVGAIPKANILLIDDNPVKLLTLECALAGLEQNLFKACSADEALRYLSRQDFAVILLDVNMPGMHGFELAERIRRQKQSCHTPVLFAPAVNRQRLALSKAMSWVLSTMSTHQHQNRSQSSGVCRPVQQGPQGATICGRPGSAQR